MRPIRLDVTGFSAFREPTSVDFDDADFFALVGPTGSGKSSVIDAICFGLYGCVPRYGSQKAVAPAITIGALEAKVSLTFEVAGTRYVATRVVRRTKTGGATTRAASLERVQTDGGATTVVAGNADGVTAAVERLLGLPFEHFTKCVVLPQGDFARFLHDSPAARGEVLVKLLNLGLYSQVGRRARELADVAAGRLLELRPRLERLAWATDALERQVSRRYAGLAAARGAVDAAMPALEMAATELERARGAAEAARRRADLVDAIDVPTEVDEAGRRLEALEALLPPLRAAAADSVAAVVQADEALGAFGERGPLEADVAVHEDLLDVEAQLADAEAAATSAASRGAEVDARLRTAEASLADARKALQGVRAAHAAHALATDLVVGEPCPVCLDIVDAVPARPPVAALAEAERTEADRASDVEERRADVAETERAAAAARATLATLGAQRARLRGRLLGRPALDVARATLRAIESAEDNLGELRHLSDQAASVLAERTRERDGAAAALQRTAAAFHAQRDALAELGPPPPGDLDVATAWRALADWATAQRATQLAAEAAASDQASKAEARRCALLDELVRTAEAAGLEHPARDAAELRVQLERAVAEAAAEHERVRSSRREASEVAADVDSAAEEQTVGRSLHLLLSAAGFQRWLVREALERLVVGASATLRELSGSQYSLAIDDRNEFQVIDHQNADERRSAKTLSGGETFQASLALALAIADQLVDLAAEGAARLESLFLDEGFGTLDPETLEVVAATVENLGSRGRMVGVVTHVRELADRVPIRFEVSRDDRTARVEKVVV